MLSITSITSITKSKTSSPLAETGICEILGAGCAYMLLTWGEGDKIKKISARLAPAWCSAGFQYV